MKILQSVNMRINPVLVACVLLVIVTVSDCGFAQDYEVQQDSIESVGNSKILSANQNDVGQFTSDGKLLDSETLKLWSVDSLTKVFQDAEPGSDTPAPLDVARGEDASFQIVFRCSNAVTALKASFSKPFQFKSEGKTHQLPKPTLRFVGFVPVDRPIQTPSADILRAAPANFPDPLLVNPLIDVGAEQAQPIWVSLKVPPMAKPGLYHGELTVTGTNSVATGGQPEFVGTIPLSLKVYRVTVGRSRMWASCWLSPQMNHMQVDAAGFSPEYWDLMRKIAKNIAAHRQNVVKIAPQKISQFSVGKDGGLEIDFTRFDKTVQLFIDEGVIGRIEGEPLGRRSKGWNSPFVIRIRKIEDGKVIETTAAPDSKDADEYCRWYLTKLTKHLQIKGWTDLYIQHLADEPTQKTKESYYQISQLVRKYAPGIKLIEAVQTSELPDGAVDIWVPLLSTLANQHQAFEKKRQAGAEIWAYVCWCPQGEYANRLIEQPLIKTRLLSWINFRYGLSGHLNWGYNSWRKVDPYKQTTIKGGPTYLAAGDAWIVYPGKGEPIDSIRHEAWRDGSADFELLSMLAQKDKAAAMKIAKKHIIGFSEYDSDVMSFRNSRRQLLVLLSKQASDK